MATPQERIAAGQELRKRGRLSPEQDAALSELERRYGGGQPAARPPSNASMVEQSEIPGGMNWRQMNPRQVQNVDLNSALDATYIPSAGGLSKLEAAADPGPPMTYVDDGLLGLQKGMRKGDIERFDPASLDRPMDTGVRTKMPRSQSVALGVVDMGYPIARQLGNLAIDTADVVPGVNLEGVKLPSAEGNLRPALTQSLQDNPISTRGGQGIALASGGGAQLYTKGMTMAPRLVSPAVAARFAGQTVGARLGRYGGRLAAMTGLGALDYAAYNALAEAPNQARVEGAEMPSIGERAQFALQEAFTPGGVLAAAIPGAGSIVYRTGRGALTAGKNTAQASIAAGRPTLAAGSFTPKDVQARVAASTINPRTGRMAREEAIDLLLKKGFKPDDAEKAVKLLSYDNYSTVDEMLFELSNADIDQLAVALGRVGGDAKKTFREGFEQRNAEMPDRIRVALRDALGLSGDDMESFGLQMANKAQEASAEGYKAAYGKQVSDETWGKIWDRLSVSPDSADAITAASRLAKNSYAGDPAKLEVARQLDELAGAIGQPGVRPPKLSTHALDFLDRGFGSLIAGAQRQNPQYARSLIEIRNAIRKSGLDADTGLNIPRTTYAQFMAAKEAMEFGQKAATNQTPLRDLKGRFAAALRAADEAAEEGIGEGKSVIDQALIMGWLRGTEDLVEKSTNPSALIRQIYGSERQRAKLLEMMPEVPRDATSGIKGDQTKRIAALVGRPDRTFDFAIGEGRASGKTPVESLFDRQRRMLGSQSRVSGNSQTGDVTEAINAQGGLQRSADLIARAVMSPQQAAQNAILWAAQRVTQPAIFKPGINRELGDILTTRGREKLLSVIDEIRQRQLARSGGTPPAPGTPPRPPPAPRGGGGAPAAAAQNDGFAKARAAGKVTPEERAILFGGGDDIKASGFVFRPRQTKAEPFNDPRLTASENKAVEMRRNGFTVREMADEMDTSEDAVYKFIQTAKAKGVDVGEQGKDRVRDSVLDLASKRVPQSAIAQRLGISSNNVKVILANARKQAGENAPDWLKPRALANGLPNAFRQDLGNAGAGALGGGVMPLPSTGDPEQDMRNRLGLMGAMAAVGAGGPRVAKSFAPGARSMGMGGGAGPKIPAHGYDDLRIGRASVEVTRVGDGMTINRIKVPESARGQGEASMALKEVLRQADEQGITTYLTADPVGAGGLSKSQLEAFYKRNGFVPNKGRNKDFSSTAGMIRRPKPTQTMGLGGGRKPPKDSPEAIRAGVQKIVEGLRASETARPPGQVIAPRGNMRGAIVPPDRAAIRAAARAAREQAMAEQVPPPLPPRPPSARLPRSSAPTQTELGLLAGTGLTGGALYMTEKNRIMHANQGK